MASALAVLACVLLAAPAAQADAPVAGQISVLSHAQVHKMQWWIVRLSLDKTHQISEGAGQTVAVLDTGVDGHNKDLAGALVSGYVLDGAHGDGSTDTDPAQHGTRMAADIASRGTGFGLDGIAPKAKILPVAAPAHSVDHTAAVLDKLSSLPHPPGVVNMSYGVPFPCASDTQAAVVRAIKAGMVLVAGAGNSGQLGNLPQSPADCKGVVAVSGINNNADIWSGSNTGSYVSLSGPAQHVIGQDAQAKSGFGYADGTSDASAIVSGIMADVRAKFPTESPRGIVTRVLWTAHQFSGARHTRNNNYGYGVAVPYAALTGSVPSSAPNPLYDAIGLTAANPTGSAAPSHSAGSSSASPGSGAHSVDQAGASNSSSGSGSSTGLIVGVVGGALVLVLLAVLLIRSRRRPAYDGPPAGQWPPGPGVGPGPGYGPPGPGDGPGPGYGPSGP